MGAASWLMGHLRRSIPYLAGLGVGLYLARIAAETTRSAWSLPALLALTVFAAGVGLGLVHLIVWQPRIDTIAGIQFRPDPRELTLRQRRQEALWTALPLWLYVFWPRQDPTVALGVALTSLIAGVWRLASFRPAGDRERLGLLDRALGFGGLLDLLVFLISAVFYSLALAPGLLPADGGEFQLVAARFGVAHPPGYPLYSLLGGLFVRFPLGPNPAW